MKKLVKIFLSEALLWVCNHVICKVPFHFIRIFFYKKFMKFSISRKVSIFLGCSFDSRGGLYIGENCVINEKCRIDTRGCIRIGSNVSISAGVVILTADHDASDPEFGGRQKSVLIEDYVFIGTGAMILPGLKIGKGAVIGARSVVTKDVMPFTVVAGNPAKIIGNRSKELRYKVEYNRLFH